MSDNNENVDTISTVIGIAQRRPNNWFTIDEPMTYNHYIQLKAQYPDHDLRFRSLTDNPKTPAGNSSGSRLGIVKVFYYDAVAGEATG